MQALIAASALSAKPPQHLVDKLMAMQLTDEEESACAATFCKFHCLHKTRYELWTRTHTRIKQCAANAATFSPQALAKVTTIGDDIAQMETKIASAGPAYIQVMRQYVKRLQRDLRINIAATWNEKAQRWADSCENKVVEVDEQITKNIDARKAKILEGLNRFEEDVREEYWKNQQRRTKLNASDCASECRNFQAWKYGGYTGSLKMMAAIEQAKRAAQTKEVNELVASKVERERLQKERDLDIWLAKMEQLQLLQQDQAEKGRTLMFDRVEKKLRKVDEEQVIEFRNVLARLQQHTNRVQHVLDKVQRGQTVRLCSHEISRGDTKPFELESFAHCVVQSELHAVGGQELVESCFGANCGRPSDDEATGGATSSSGIASSCSMELATFAEFLALRFHNLRAAFASMDLNNSGRITCFKLQMWMISQSCPGDPRTLFKELDHKRQGYIGLSNLSLVAAIFSRCSLQCGRPHGPLAAAVLARIAPMFSAAGNSSAVKPTESLFFALRCCQRIFRFLSYESTGGILPSTGETPDILDMTQSHLPTLLSLSTVTSHSNGNGNGSASDVHKDASCTDLGRWAKDSIEDCIPNRRQLMHCGPQRKRLSGDTPPRSRSVSQTPPRSRSASRERRRTSGCARETANNWSQNLRSYEPARARRGAPPPKCHTNAQGSLPRASSRSASAPRERTNANESGRSTPTARIGSTYSRQIVAPKVEVVVATVEDDRAGTATRIQNRSAQISDHQVVPGTKMATVLANVTSGDITSDDYKYGSLKIEQASGISVCSSPSRSPVRNATVTPLLQTPAHVSSVVINQPVRVLASPASTPLVSQRVDLNPLLVRHHTPTF